VTKVKQTDSVQPGAHQSLRTLRGGSRTWDEAGRTRRETDRLSAGHRRRCGHPAREATRWRRRQQHASDGRLAVPGGPTRAMC